MKHTNTKTHANKKVETIYWQPTFLDTYPEAFGIKPGTPAANRLELFDKDLPLDSSGDEIIPTLEEFISLDFEDSAYLN